VGIAAGDSLEFDANTLMVAGGRFAARSEGVDAEREEVALADTAPLGGAEFEEALLIGLHGGPVGAEDSASVALGKSKPL
jgi:hypothetical protein